MTIEEATADVDVKVLDAATLKEGESLAKRELNGWTLIGHLDHRDFTRKSGCKMPRLLLVETPLRACLAWADFSVTKVRSSNFSTPAPNDEEKFRPFGGINNFWIARE